jgi:sterol desaturase/sphingolipid hydroxylase (fatty acid hydroxylase superfamily)
LARFPASIPLHAQSRDHAAHIKPNLALTFLTFATNAVLNTLVVWMLIWLFAVYRLASALNGLLEHANIELPAWLDRAASWVTTWPSFHKVHHSRVPAETDSNYGNLFSFWDRLLGTSMPASRGATVAFGLEGFDHPAQQTTAGLLAMPFVEDDRGHADAAA